MNSEYETPISTLSDERDSKWFLNELSTKEDLNSQNDFLSSSPIKGNKNLKDLMEWETSLEKEISKIVNENIPSALQYHIVDDKEYQQPSRFINYSYSLGFEHENHNLLCLVKELQDLKVPSVERVEFSSGGYSFLEYLKLIERYHDLTSRLNSLQRLLSIYSLTKSLIIKDIMSCLELTLNRSAIEIKRPYPHGQAVSLKEFSSAQCYERHKRDHLSDVQNSFRERRNATRERMFALRRELSSSSLYSSCDSEI